jgi:hypothetical protein
MDQSRKDDSMPTRSSNMEPAEGSRETVRDDINQGGGITNRGRDREQSEQERLPERGRSQDESPSSDSMNDASGSRDRGSVPER